MGEIFARVIPDTPLAWTGERLTSAVAGQIEIEHLHRYFLARALCRGLDVLDVAAGEGYGTALLAQTARSVIGVEISHGAVAHAAAAYRGSNFRFVAGDARCLPLDDASVDAVVSFETIEHFYEHEQFLAEVRRVLRPGGRFVVSSPERDVYSPSGSGANPYHVRELSRAELSALLRSSFAHVRLLGQRPMLGSALVSEDSASGGTLTFEKRGPQHFEVADGLPRPVYFVAVASDQPVTDVPDSLYIETAEIGAVLGAAAAADAATAELTALRTQATADEKAAPEMSAPLDTTQAAEKARAAAVTWDPESARTEIAAARAEATAACLQRDIARTAARRAAAASEGHWLGRSAELEHRVAEAEQQAAIADRRATAAEQQLADAERRAAEWQRRYEALRARLEELLRRFGLRSASRLIPPSGRRFLRDRLLGWGR